MTPSFLKHRLSRLSFLSCLLSGVGGILSILALGLVLFKERSSSWDVATVDLQKIVTSASDTLIKSYPKGNVPPSVMEKVVQHIKETTEAYGRTHRVMIVAKGAILSGEKEDLTDVILHILEKGGAPK